MAKESFRLTFERTDPVNEAQQFHHAAKMFGELALERTDRVHNRQVHHVLELVFKGLRHCLVNAKGWSTSTEPVDGHIIVDGSLLMSLLTALDTGPGAKLAESDNTLVFYWYAEHPGEPFTQLWAEYRIGSITGVGKGRDNSGIVTEFVDLLAERKRVASLDADWVRQAERLIRHVSALLDEVDELRRYVEQVRGDLDVAKAEIKQLEQALALLELELYRKKQKTNPRKVAAYAAVIAGIVGPWGQPVVAHTLGNDVRNTVVIVQDVQRACGERPTPLNQP